MSLIGPRPLLVAYLPRYNEFQRHRHDVRPGLTGYAQAHGRNAVSWEDKFAMDVWYTTHITFKEDIKIILSTINTVLKHEGKNVSRPYVEHSFSVLGGSYENGMDDRDNCRDSFYSLSIILLYCCRKRVR